MGAEHEHHYHYLPTRLSEEERYRAAQRVTVVGAVLNLLLSVGKIVVGVVGNSQSLIADGVHSLSDLLSDVLVLVAAKHGSRDADETHPYGHARIETVVTVGLGLLLMLVAAGILYDAIQRLFHTEQLLQPGLLALAMAVASVLSKEWLFHYTQRVAKRLRSNLLHANAWHHRSDAVSSIVVIVGIGGTMAGLPYLDAIAAAGVALMIAKVGWDLSWHSVRELIDTALDADRVEAIRDLILSVDGVHALHMLRTRRMGRDALADVHILVDPRLSVSEGHHISEVVRSRLIDEIDEVQDVLVHIDPEDDERSAPSINLPARHEILDTLRLRWRGVAAAEVVERVVLHYLNGKVWAEVFLPLSIVADADAARELATRLSAAVESVPELGGIEVYFR